MRDAAAKAVLRGVDVRAAANAALLMSNLPTMDGAGAAGRARVGAGHSGAAGGREAREAVGVDSLCMERDGAGSGPAPAAGGMVNGNVGNGIDAATAAWRSEAAKVFAESGGRVVIDTPDWCPSCGLKRVGAHAPDCPLFQVDVSASVRQVASFSMNSMPNVMGTAASAPAAAAAAHLR